jgi:hypothetical protein
MEQELNKMYRPERQIKFAETQLSLETVSLAP